MGMVATVAHAAAARYHGRMTIKKKQSHSLKENGSAGKRGVLFLIESELAWKPMVADPLGGIS